MMLKKNLQNTIIPVLAVFVFCNSCSQQSTSGSTENEDSKPNVLLLFTDQHNKDVLGFENHPDVITPNLDKFAEEALIFDRAYCTIGICVPSRASLMTGLMPRTLGLLSNRGGTSVQKEAVSMATIFKHNGYATYAFGKRHTDYAIDEGWDIKKGHNAKPGEDDDYVSWIEREGYIDEFAQDWAAEFGKGPKGSSTFEKEIPTADLGTRISQLPEEYTMEAHAAMETIEIIKKHANSDTPFFCWASFYRPHQPYTPQQRYMDMYDVSNWGKGTKNGSSIKMPDNFYEPTENLPPLMQEQRNGGNKVWNMDKAFEDEQLWRNYIGAYYALVTEIDHHIGEIIKTLEEANIKEETIIIYTSDHGDFVGNHGMVEKCAAGQNVYEDILNIPLLIKIPGQKHGGKRTAELVTLTDVLPTLIEVLDLEIPDLQHPIQGESMAGIILENGSLNREYIVSESWSQATIITENSKLGIMQDPMGIPGQGDYRDFGDMFFDMEEDPLEVDNKIDDEAKQDEIEKLRSYYEEYIKNTPSTGRDEMIQQYQQTKN